MKIYFTRHSKTVWNEEHRLQGWKNSPLTKEGEEDAKRLRDRMKNIPIDICYSSPIARARETAEIIFDQVPIITDNRLKELNFGKFEGHKVSDVKDNPVYHALWHNPTADLRLPEGESLSEIFTRVQDWLEEVYKKHAQDTIFVTGHGMVCIVLMTIMKKLPIEEMLQASTVMRGCALSCVNYDGDEFDIEYIFDESHLPVLDKEINYTK